MTIKLEDSNTAPKTYWAILNRLLCNKKIPDIRRLLVNSNFISDYCEKANLFNNFFVTICVLPSLLYNTNTRISSFRVLNRDILSVINSLDSSKSHGYDNVSVRMAKICSESVTIPLKIIFEESLKKGIFPEIWKKANVVPVHKKEGKILIKNYRTILILPIFGKIFERIIYNSLIDHFLSNKLFTPSQ